MHSKFILSECVLLFFNRNITNYFLYSDYAVKKILSQRILISELSIVCPIIQS